MGSIKEHDLDCYADHEHTAPECCKFNCWCTKTLEEGLCRLEDIKINTRFECPWNGQTFTLLSITPSAAWVEVIEDKEFEITVRKTGQTKLIKTKIKRNEPWSRQTVVKPL